MQTNVIVSMMDMPACPEVYGALIQALKVKGHFDGQSTNGVEAKEGAHRDGAERGIETQDGGI